MGAKYRGRFGGAAAQAVRSVRGVGKGRIDPQDVARQMGLRVRTCNLSGGVKGWTTSADEVVLQSRLGGTERRYVLAHEIGHVLVRRGALSFRCRRTEECFADAFARELLLPAVHVGSAAEGHTAQLCRRYGVPGFVVALQMARIGLAPPIMRDLRGSVLCVTCGHRVSLSECECLRYRQNPRLRASLAKY